MRFTPSMVVATAALFLALGGGSYAAVSATGPSKAQFNALRTQVGLLRERVVTLENDVAALPPPATDADAQTVACLKSRWNTLQLWKLNTFANNGAIYDSSQPPPDWATLRLAVVPAASQFLCN